MASTSQQNEEEPGSSSVVNPVDEVRAMTWGSELKEDVFLRWSQGFVFSDDEPMALLQYEGGPCAIIAPLQAFLVKNLLFSQESQCEEGTESWRQTNGDQRKHLLLCAMQDVISSVSSGSYFLVLQEDKQELTIENVAGSSDGEPTHVTFHRNLRIQTYKSEDELRGALMTTYHMFVGHGGVLLFLYSVLLTKGLAIIQEEMEDPSEPLIDGIYGHGNQCLINLMVTGRAVSNVFDHEKDVAGLQMKGISKQSLIGFLTILENLKYCEVGTLLKNPNYPIWLLASETHLTVFFSRELALVATETKWEEARRVFSEYDTEGSGFIQCAMLQNVLEALELVAVPEYVEFMTQRLDPEKCGIVLQNMFMAEFFPDEPDRLLPEYFTVYHYNGISRSNPNSKVMFLKGRGSAPNPGELEVLTEATPLKSCLRTKWPTFEADWENNVKPSIN
ncbi:ubiquitin carboxyl-terminal hydrolase MINDY-3 [Strongylocentrotus purpuratus]|uniref:Ubiquitin carboxyl-terminal hydrolase MINDY n=1 Tax=Strongylocentrotus purpuratus TaxID=7668 RepID=A0A7M7N379_STRPU|nr:ubiquitin carboxyl-terminal hydrolase MINDY-3 [Strongylocentrotus purpuratus]